MATSPNAPESQRRSVHSNEIPGIPDAQGSVSQRMPPRGARPPVDQPEPVEGVSAQHAQAVISRLPGKFNRCLAAIASAIERCKADRTTVAERGADISSDTAKDHFDQAVAKLDEQTEHLRGLRHNVHQIATNASAALDRILIELGVAVEDDTASQADQTSSGRREPDPHPGVRLGRSKEEARKLTDADMEQHAMGVLGIDPAIIKKARQAKPKSQ